MFEVVNNNFKNTLFEISAAYFGIFRPVYFHFEYGPPHDKVFFCICSFQRRTTSHEGRTKIEAEQKAAQEMLQILKDNFFIYHHALWTLKTDSSLTVSADVSAVIQSLNADPRFDVLSLYGDAVLRYHIARYLFDKYPQFKEGILTLITSEALQEETRADVARHLVLEQCVRTEVTPRTLAQALSATIGKLAKTVSDELCKDFIMTHYKSFIDLSVANILASQRLDDSIKPLHAIETKIHNYKNELLEYAQRKSIVLPQYSLVTQNGDAHAPTFTVSCHFQGQSRIGEGRTIKSAEQDATRLMLSYLKNRNVDHVRRLTESSKYFSAPRQGCSKRFKAPALSSFKRRIGWCHFDNLEYLEEAFTHPSKSQQINYQRLEFLGDAILKKILLSYVLEYYPLLSEKDFLSSQIDQLVSERMQACVAHKLGLGEHIFSDTLPSSSMLSDVLEALISAVFLDSEIKKSNGADRAIVHWYKTEIETLFGKSTKLTPALSANPSRFLSSKPRNIPDQGISIAPQENPVSKA